MAYLLATNGLDRGQAHKLVLGDNVIGRDADCTVHLNLPSVSRKHVRLVADDPHFTISDLNSANGTKINGHQLTNPVSLQPGDAIKIGDLEFLFVLKLPDIAENVSGSNRTNFQPTAELSTLQRRSELLAQVRAFFCDHGFDEVENMLDSCHALMNYGVDRYKRPQKISLQEEKNRQEEREAYLQSQVNELWRTLPNSPHSKHKEKIRFPQEPQENLLYFIEKNAPLLEPWQREIVRIVRKVSQYFYPQKQTQVMNEGWACFWHYHILNEMYDEGLVSDRFMMEFLHSHSSVVMQPEYNSPYYSGINPYALGFSMFMDIKRVCQSPTEEDYKYLPSIAGKDWLETVHFAMENFKDESFISQFLSPKVIRDFKLFALEDDTTKPFIAVSAIHDEMGYQIIKEKLSAQYNLSNLEPNIQVHNVDVRGDRSLTLRYIPQRGIPLGDSKDEVMRHLHRLWKFDVRLEQDNGDDGIDVISECKRAPQA